MVHRPGQLVGGRPGKLVGGRPGLEEDDEDEDDSLVDKLRRLPEKNKSVDLRVSDFVSLGVWATVSLGEWAIVSLGDWAFVSLRDWATVSLGNWATVSLGDWATVSLGDWAIVTMGTKIQLKSEEMADPKRIDYKRVDNHLKMDKPWLYGQDTMGEQHESYSNV